MNIQELQRRLHSVQKIGFGTYVVTVMHVRREGRHPGVGVIKSNQYRSHITLNSAAVYRITSHGELPDRAISHGYTYAQALRALIRPKKTQKHEAQQHTPPRSCPA